MLHGCSLVVLLYCCFCSYAVLNSRIWLDKTWVLLCYNHFFLRLYNALFIFILIYPYRATSKHFSHALRGCWLFWMWKILCYQLLKKQNQYGQKNSGLARWNLTRYMFCSTSYKLGSRLTIHHFILAFCFTLIYN